MKNKKEMREFRNILDTRRDNLRNELDFIDKLIRLVDKRNEWDEKILFTTPDNTYSKKDISKFNK
jgi:hypothetical protein